MNTIRDAAGNMDYVAKDYWVGTGGAQASATYYAIKDHQNTVVVAIHDVPFFRSSALRCGVPLRTENTGLESGATPLCRALDPAPHSAVMNTIIGNQQSAIGNRYTFQGREIDWATGLYYFRARWYNPETGRWLSKDPIGVRGGLNQYVFCHNDPVNFIDPFGLEERAGANAGGINNNSLNGVNVYAPEYGTQTVPPGGSTPPGDWDSVENPAGSGNWEKIGPGTSTVDKNGNLRSNWRRWLDKNFRNPDGYKPGNFPTPPKDGSKE